MGWELKLRKVCFQGKVFKAPLFFRPRHRKLKSCHGPMIDNNVHVAKPVTSVHIVQHQFQFRNKLLTSREVNQSCFSGLRSPRGGTNNYNDHVADTASGLMVICAIGKSSKQISQNVRNNIISIFDQIRLPFSTTIIYTAQFYFYVIKNGCHSILEWEQKLYLLGRRGNNNTK